MADLNTPTWLNPGVDHDTSPWLPNGSISLQPGFQGTYQCAVLPVATDGNGNIKVTSTPIPFNSASQKFTIVVGGNINKGGAVFNWLFRVRNNDTSYGDLRRNFLTSFGINPVNGTINHTVQQAGGNFQLGQFSGNVDFADGTDRVFISSFDFNGGSPTWKVYAGTPLVAPTETTGSAGGFSLTAMDATTDSEAYIVEQSTLGNKTDVFAYYDDVYVNNDTEALAVFNSGYASPNTPPSGSYNSITQR